MIVSLDCNNNLYMYVICMHLYLYKNGVQLKKETVLFWLGQPASLSDAVFSVFFND